MKKIFKFTVILLIGLVSIIIIVNQKSINTSLNKLESVQTSQSDNLVDSPQTTIIAQNLDTPWAIAFLPDNSMLVTERLGKVRLIDKSGFLQENPILLLDKVKEFGEGGLLGIAVHPVFSANKYIYLYYTYEGAGNETLNRVSRFSYQNNSLINEKIIIDAIPGAKYHNGGRIKFGPDGFLYITTGDANQASRAQDKNSLAGKILRVTDEGKSVPGNPFNNLIYSIGHRNPQGLAWDNSNQLWENEHGPSGIWPNCCQDEVNQIIPGNNYGWPQSVGDNVLSNTKAPLLHSGKNIWAPAGAAFINGSLFFTGLRGSALYKLNPETKELNKHFENKFGRLREIIVGPDNLLYVTTSNKDGRGKPQTGDDKIIRINPGKL